MIKYCLLRYPMIGIWAWASYQIRKITGAHATGMPGTFSVMHVGIAYLRWRGKRSRHSRRMRTRDFAYLARGPLLNSEGHQLCSLSRKLQLKRVTNTPMRSSLMRVTPLDIQTFKWTWRSCPSELPHWYLRNQTVTMKNMGRYTTRIHYQWIIWLQRHKVQQNRVPILPG